jgi:hypothetical protein
VLALFPELPLTLIYKDVWAATPLMAFVSLFIRNCFTKKILIQFGILAGILVEEY